MKVINILAMSPILATMLILPVSLTAIPLLVLPADAGPLHSAAYRGDPAGVRQCIAQGHSIDEMDSSGTAPLHYAARMGHIDVIEFLLSEGAVVDIESAGEANTPLHLASGAGHVTAAEVLLEGGTDIDHRNEDGETALHWAVGNGRIRMVEFLLSQGADMEVRDSEGMTPLHRSVGDGYAVIVDNFLARGANAGTRDKGGASPMDTALKQGYVRIARVLKLAGASLDTWRDLVTFIQNQLWLRGYGIDQLDGLAGANTAAAIKKYQNHAGISQDGLASHSLADHLAASGEIAPYLSGGKPTVTNIFVSWYPLAYEHEWDPRLLWSRGETLDDGTSAVDNDFRGTVKYTGLVRFAHLEIEGTAWVLSNGWVIAHGSKVSLQPLMTTPAGY